MKIKNVVRVVVYNKEKESIILVRNKNEKYWYPPGGEWEFAIENVKEGAAREVKEEVGIDVEIEKLIYVQEFQAYKDKKFFETFWLAYYGGEIDLNHKDSDEDSPIDEIREYKKEELAGLVIYPEVLKNKFWDDLDNFEKSEDIFLGFK